MKMMTTTSACAAILAMSTLTLGGCASSGAAENSANTSGVSGKLRGQVLEIANQAQEMNKPALIVVDASYCPTCKAYKRNTLDIAATREALDERTVFRTLDFDENKDELARIGVNGFPTTILVVDGEPVASFTGRRDGDALLAWIDEHAG